MLTSCPTLPDELMTLLDSGYDTDELGAQDPISRSGPDGLPCQVQDADLWFAETPDELEQAKSFCEACPARLACLSGAIDRREPWGVWGGEIFERGSVVARKRPRGRPRKTNREVAA
jgi:WhiB family redox-sensing transcriptional regulator